MRLSPSRLIFSPFFPTTVCIKRRNSDPGSHSRLFFSPSQLRPVRCIFVERRLQCFLPSSICVEFRIPSPGVIIHCFLTFIVDVQKFPASSTMGFELQDQRDQPFTAVPFLEQTSQTLSNWCRKSKAHHSD